jgi:GT2 family glycosyltransferase
MGRRECRDRANRGRVRGVVRPSDPGGHLIEVSVAIATRDRPDALGRCLDGIRAGTLSPQDIVVVDQSSDERSERIVVERQGGSAPVRYMRQHERGLAPAQNAAIRTAAADVVAITDDDCVPNPTWLAVVAAAFEADADLGLLTGRVLPLPTADTTLVPVSTRPSAVRVQFEASTAPWEIGSGNNFALRKSAFESVHGCDVRLGPGRPGRGALDIDLFYRLVRAGVRARYEPDAVVLHEQKPRSERRSRRPDYGFGMGACCMLWHRAGDPNAMNVLRHWLAFRGRLLLLGLRTGHPGSVYEEALMLVGTARGVLYSRRLER